MVKWITEEPEGVREHLIARTREKLARYPSINEWQTPYGAQLKRLEAGEPVEVSWMDLRPFIERGDRRHFRVEGDGTITPVELDRTFTPIKSSKRKSK